jgi:hypothetical protein
LFQEADVVLIVEATDAVDSKEKVNDRAFGQFLGVNTTLKVNRAIKGQPGNFVTVLHYRLAKIDDPDARDPLGFVSFDTRGPENSEPRTEYLVFLRRRPDGRFEPVSGRDDANLSVRELRPMPAY